MRTRTLLPAALGVLLGGLLFAADARADQKITSQQVKDKCGSGLQSGGGAFGCTKCTPASGPFGSSCIDYSCNNSGQGRQGCWRTPIKAEGTPSGGGKGTKDIGSPATGVKSIGTRPDRGKLVGGTSGFKPTGVGGFVRRK
jgi:hypothetical protein